MGSKKALGRVTVCQNHAEFYQEAELHRRIYFIMKFAEMEKKKWLDFKERLLYITRVTTTLSVK